jgi:hypothetical protein
MTHDDDGDLHRALGAYRTPPPMPAEELWSAIQAGLAADEPHPSIPLSPWARRIRPRLITALAASLALFVTGTGVGFGVARLRDDDAAGAERRADVAANGREKAVLYRVTWF